MFETTLAIFGWVMILGISLAVWPWFLSMIVAHDKSFHEPVQSVLLPCDPVDEFNEQQGIELPCIELLPVNTRLMAGIPGGATFANWATDHAFEENRPDLVLPRFAGADE